MDRKPALALTLGLLTATGIWLLAISTPSGLGLIDDAISYIAAARALLHGQGFTRIWLSTNLEPITHWPPAFPATLAAISFVLKVDPYRSARLLNMLVFGGNAALLALLGYKMTQSDVSAMSKHLRRGSLISGVILSILFLSNSAILRLHTQALSEPLYIFISLLAFFAFARAFENTPVLASPNGSGQESIPTVGRVKWLLLTGFLTALSYLTRYAALSLLATFIIAIFVLRPTWRTRLISLGYFLIGALPLIFIWMFRNKLVGGTATNRSIEWHPVTLANTQRGLHEFFAFLVPLLKLRTGWYANGALLALLLGIITLALLAWLLPRGLKYFFAPTKTEQPELLSFTMALYIFGYMGSLLVSLSFFDAATPLNDRILSPVYVAVLLLLVYFSQKFYEQGKIAAKLISSVVVVFLLTIFGLAQFSEVKTLQETPTGFASWRWQESTVMAAIRELPAETLVYTNQAPAVYFWTDRPAMMIWDVAETHTALLNDDAVLAIFFPGDNESLDLSALTEGLTPVVKSGLGNLYIYEQK